MHYALECANLSKSFGEIAAVRRVSLVTQPGHLTALLGPSGCGKTTLLRLIAGFEEPDEGHIVINGRLVAGKGQMVPPEQRRVGMVFQEYALFQHLDVASNIAFGLRGPAEEKQARVREMLSLVGLEGFERRRPYELSGGQQQRVALARALAPQPDILLLDEPFSNLDTALRTQIRAEVKAILRATHTTCIFVTHDQEEALSLADEVAVMLEGHILQVAPPQELYHRPNSRAVAAFVGETNFLPGHAQGDSVSCPLGNLPLLTPMHGPVDVHIRPEALTLERANGTARQGRVVWQEFYGHDQRLGVTLQDGTALIVRLGPDSMFTVGESVAVRATAPVMAFPAASTTD